MSVTAGSEWKWNDWTIEGLSLSGIRTCLAVPQLGFTWDVAQGYPFSISAKQFFLSHGHMDHAAGVPYILSQKAMYSQKKPSFYMPHSLVEPLTKIIRLWEEIEKHTYEFDFIGVKDRDVVQVNNQFEMEAFTTVHRVDSFGYTLIEKKKKLKTEFAGKSEKELRDIRSRGVDLNEIHKIPLMSFTGDTQIEFLDVSPQTRKSKLLIMEATYLDDKKTIQNAKTWGHTHLDEIIERLPEIESEAICLIHISSRYSTEEALKIINARVPKSDRERIHIFPGR